MLRRSSRATGQYSSEIKDPALSSSTATSMILSAIFRQNLSSFSTVVSFANSIALANSLAGNSVAKSMAARIRAATGAKARSDPTAFTKALSFIALASLP